MLYKCWEQSCGFELNEIQNILVIDIIDVVKLFQKKKKKKRLVKFGRLSTKTLIVYRNFFSIVSLFFYFESVAIELLLKLFIRKIDTQLFKTRILNKNEKEVGQIRNKKKKKNRRKVMVLSQKIYIFF